MLNILIVEDDVNASELCGKAIWHILRDCHLFRAGSVELALKIMNRQTIHAFFIDIELPGAKGFSLARKIQDDPLYVQTPIIFVTARITNELSLHKQYHHYEYIRKPFTMESFADAVGPLLQKLDLFISKTPNPHPLKRERYILLESRDFKEYVKLEDILYVETTSEGITVITSRQKFPPVKKRLEAFLQEVGDLLLVRCHKSFAVYVPNMTGLQKSGRRLWYANFENSSEMDACCPVGSSYYQGVLELLKAQKMKEE